MRAVTFGFCAAVLVAGIAVAQPVMHSLEAEEAQQGVASDGTYAYAIDNSRIGKYDIKTGQRVAQWEGPSGLFPHMNACTLVDKRLLCAASNFPQEPMTSAIEIFDPVAMKHLTTISLGMGIGSTLELAATLPIPFEGQAIDWDPKAKRLLWGISRKDRKAIAVILPNVETNVAR